MDKPRRIEVIYDGHCPLCQSYVSFVDLKSACEELVLTDARESQEARERADALGVNLDEGFMVLIDNAHYTGAQALNKLAELSDRGGPINRLNHLLFRSDRRARRLYPFMVQGRNLLLKALGRTKINS